MCRIRVSHVACSFDKSFDQEEVVLLRKSTSKQILGRQAGSRTLDRTPEAHCRILFCHGSTEGQGDGGKRQDAKVGRGGTDAGSHGQDNKRLVATWFQLRLLFLRPRSSAHFLSLSRPRLSFLLGFVVDNTAGI